MCVPVCVLLRDISISYGFCLQTGEVKEILHNFHLLKAPKDFKMPFKIT